METVASVADTDANVLIVGESGTGKELIANALHERSARRDGPWIKINCAALPKDLIESELFGHTRGSFTGATTEKVGLLEEAHNGSLLLDEITEMPIDLQAKLLRVLEERVVRRLGGAKSIPVDFRLISSTNRSPEQAVKEGQLRQDLYFRINTVTIAVPPLRERREDIPILVRAFLERYRAKHQRAGRRHRARGLSPPARPTPGRATCASCSTPSSARCWWRAGARSRWPTCPSRCSTAAGEGGLGRQHRAVRGAGRLAGGDRARVDPQGARHDPLEQAGRRRAARPAPPDALLEDAQAQHPAAPALTRPRGPQPRGRPKHEQSRRSAAYSCRQGRGPPCPRGVQLRRSSA